MLSLAILLVQISPLQNSGLPWSPPKKALNVDFGDLGDAISSALGVSWLTCTFMVGIFPVYVICSCTEFLLSSRIRNLPFSSTHIYSSSLRRKLQNPQLKILKNMDAYIAMYVMPTVYRRVQAVCLLLLE